ncbi:MAG TPA: cupin domain-containing protein [Dehalococcoidia bacterium]|nr:cupin domain-containing protein [Dehalococcoidia bacterium]
MPQDFPGVKVTKPKELVREDATGFEVAVSPAVSGSKGLVFGSAKVPGGLRIPAHTHTVDTAALLISGRAALRYGEKLETRLEMSAGDFAFVGANVIHDEETLGDEVAEFIMARDNNGGETIPVDPSDPGWAALGGGD